MSSGKEAKKVTETITVTAALIERKMLKKRIDREIKGGAYFGITVGEAKRPHNREHTTVESQASAIQSSVDKVHALVRRYRSLVGALVTSNALTKITIGGREISIAEAIEYKTSISFDLLLASTIKESLKAHAMTVSSLQNQMDTAIQVKLVSFYSGDSVPDVNSEQFNQIANPHKAQHAPVLHDPAKLVASVPDLVTHIETFSNEVEVALNISNASTSITFEY